MKSLILCLSLIWVLGCTTDDAWTPEPIDVASLGLPDGWSITAHGLIMPPGYCEGADGIPYYCGDQGGGGGGGGGGFPGGGGGGGGVTCSSVTMEVYATCQVRPCIFAYDNSTRTGRTNVTYEVRTTCSDGSSSSSRFTVSTNDGRCDAQTCGDEP